MIIFRTRNSSESKELLKKVKHMHKLTKELIECMEDNMEEIEDDADFRLSDDYDDDFHHNFRGGRVSRRYRRSM